VRGDAGTKGERCRRPRVPPRRADAGGKKGKKAAPYAGKEGPSEKAELVKGKKKSLPAGLGGEKKKKGFGEKKLLKKKKKEESGKGAGEGGGVMKHPIFLRVREEEVGGNGLENALTQ